jgi:hypothetical protein
VEEKEGGWVISEEVSVYYPGTVLCETAAKWTPAPGDSGSRFFGDNPELSAWENLDSAESIQQ